MKKNYQLVILLAVFFVAGLIIGGVYIFGQPVGQPESKKGTSLNGGQKDAHGCLVASGYSWCEAKGKCLRNSEEACAVNSVEPTENDIKAIRQAFMDKYKKTENEVQVNIQLFDGNYARGGVKFMTNGQFGEGGIFLAYKKNNVWKLAFDGNGMISCSEMAKLEFPEDMTLGCYDEKSGEVKTGNQVPNPASVNCKNKGGMLEIRTRDDGGQIGVCKFSDGSECEEWAFYRGECQRKDK